MTDAGKAQASQNESRQPDKKKKKKDLPANLELQRTHVICGPEMNSHTRTMTSANVYMPLGIDNAWDFAEFKENFQIKINELTDSLLVCDIIGIDPAVANALRRILIAEVPTIAIEHVFIVNNTSIIQDEVLSHRLGLVPLLVDPATLDFKTAEEAPSEKNTLVFKLDVGCYRSGDIIVNDKVLSSELKWLPGGSEMPEETGCKFAQGQSHMYAQQPPRPVHHDILLAKLRPGQCIQLEAHCIKGIAKDHAKWSPVATAWYTLLPEVVLLKEPDAEVAAQLQEAAPGLFTREKDSGKLIVGNARDHVKDLEKIRALLEQPAVAEAVQYRKKKDHFIFTIESTGIIPPEELLRQALTILHDKANRLINLL